MTLSEDPEEEEKSNVLTFSFDGAKLAPSEAVLLYGDKFTGWSGPPEPRQEKLLRIDRGVPAARLSRAAWTVALLSIEAADSIRFEIRPTISPFERRKPADLYIALLSVPCRWPAGSLERKICRKLREGSWTPGDLVYRLLEQEGAGVGYNTLRLIKEGLLERGLLTVKKSRRFGIMKSIRFKLSQRTLTMMPEHGLDDLSTLLAPTDTTRAALLRELRAQIGRGLARARHIRAKHAARVVAELAGDVLGIFH